MSEMVERVARAILAGHDWTHDDGNDPSLPTGWEAVRADWQEAYRNMARAAIGAMREPTDEMLAAVVRYPVDLVIERDDPEYAKNMKAATIAERAALRQRYRDLIDVAFNAEEQK